MSDGFFIPLLHICDLAGPHGSLTQPTAAPWMVVMPNTGLETGDTHPFAMFISYMSKNDFFPVIRKKRLLIFQPVREEGVNVCGSGFLCLLLFFSFTLTGWLLNTPVNIYSSPHIHPKLSRGMEMKRNFTSNHFSVSGSSERL